MNPAEFLLDLVSVESEDASVASRDGLWVFFLVTDFTERNILVTNG
jgi:hypothetical protein